MGFTLSIVDSERPMKNNNKTVMNGMILKGTPIYPLNGVTSR